MNQSAGEKDDPEEHVKNRGKLQIIPLPHKIHHHDGNSEVSEEDEDVGQNVEPSYPWLFGPSFSTMPAGRKSSSIKWIH
jgi:hypothetical protein